MPLVELHVILELANQTGNELASPLWRVNDKRWTVSSLYGMRDAHGMSFLTLGGNHQIGCTLNTSGVVFPAYSSYDVL